MPRNGLANKEWQQDWNLPPLISGQGMISGELPAQFF
jgi:hypothetical protein